MTSRGRSTFPMTVHILKPHNALDDRQQPGQSGRAEGGVSRTCVADRGSTRRGGFAVPHNMLGGKGCCADQCAIRRIAESKARTPYRVTPCGCWAEIRTCFPYPPGRVLSYVGLKLPTGGGLVDCRNQSYTLSSSAALSEFTGVYHRGMTARCETV